MRPTKLTLHNYAAAGDVTVDLTQGGAIGFIGENGTGKSSTIDALRLAYTGTTNKSSISKIQSWGSDGNKASVTLEGILPSGGVVRIDRIITTNTKGKASGKANITVNGDVVASTPAQAATWMEKQGLCKDVVLKNMIVEQGDLDKVLFTEPAARYKAWVNMCGLEYIAKSHDLTGTYINNLPELSDYRILLETSIEACERAAERLTAAQEVAAPLQDPGSTGAQLQMAKAEHNRFLGGVAAAEAKLLESQGALTTAQANLTTTPQADASEAATHGARKAQLEEQIQNATADAARFQAYVQAKATLDATPEPPRDDLSQMTSEITELTNVTLPSMQEAKTVVTQNLTRINTTITSATAAANETNCPTCGQEVHTADAAKATLAQAQEELKLYTPKSAEIDKLILDTTVKRQELLDKVTVQRNAMAARHLAESTYNAAAQANTVDAAPDVTALTTELATVNAAIATITQNSQAYERAKLNHTSAQSAVDFAANNLSTVRASLVDVENRIKDLGFNIDDDLDKQAEMLVAQATAYNDAQVELQSAKADLERSKESKQSAIDNIANQATEQQKRDKLQAVRDQLHYTQLPMRVVGSILEKCTETVNKFLEDFDALYRVVSDVENMSFRYYYLDGRDVGTDGALPSIIELSGGEKCIMACAFRFATYVMFSQDSGLLVLDEPTAYLDSTHVSKFAQIIPKLKRTAESLDTKLIMATHERACIPFMDGIQDFGEK